MGLSLRERVVYMIEFLALTGALATLLAAVRRRSRGRG